MVRSPNLESRLKNAIKGLIPILKYREDPYKHAEELAKDPELYRLIEKNPQYKQDLTTAAVEAYSYHNGSIRRAKWIDSYDRVKALVEIALEMTGFAAGQAAAGSLEVFDFVVKMGAAAYNCHRMRGNWSDLIYFASWEATSVAATFTVPVLGTMVDFSNIYIDRAIEHYHEAVIKKFYINTGLKTDPVQPSHQNPPSDTSLEGLIIDAEIVEPDKPNTESQLVQTKPVNPVNTYVQPERILPPITSKPPRR